MRELRLAATGSLGTRVRAVLLKALRAAGSTRRRLALLQSQLVKVRLRPAAACVAAMQAELREECVRRQRTRTLGRWATCPAGADSR